MMEHNQTHWARITTAQGKPAYANHSTTHTGTLRPTEGQGLAHSHPADEKLG